MGPHPEVKRLADKLEEELGGDRVIVTAADKIPNLGSEPAVVVLTMDSGAIGQAIEMGDAANKVVAQHPAIKLMFSINGCSDDPREIDEIPEARKVMQAFLARLKWKTFQHFEKEQRALLAVSIGLGERQGYDLIVPQWVFA